MQNINGYNNELQLKKKKKKVVHCDSIFRNKEECSRNRIVSVNLLFQVESLTYAFKLHL